MTYLHPTNSTLQEFSAFAIRSTSEATGITRFQIIQPERGKAPISLARAIVIHLLIRSGYFNQTVAAQIVNRGSNRVTTNSLNRIEKERKSNRRLDLLITQLEQDCDEVITPRAKEPTPAPKMITFPKPKAIPYQTPTLTPAARALVASV